jgi:glycerol-3-phosphate dehydrogenase
VRRSRLQLSTGLIMRTENSVLFVIPWGDFWIIGTTDTEYRDNNKENPRATENDVDYLLEHLNAVLVSPLRRDDVVGVYAGLRPLLDGGANATAKLSREHTVSRPRPGLVIVAGGKFTTYRVMAQDALDVAVEQIDRPVPASRTRTVGIVGGDGWSSLWERRDAVASEFGISVAWVEHLFHRYGSLTPQVLEVVKGDRSLAAPLEGSNEYLRCEVVYAVTHEGALHLEDVLVRRTHVSIENPDHGVVAARSVGELMAPLLGWDPKHLLDELAAFESSVATQ